MKKKSKAMMAYSGAGERKSPRHAFLFTIEGQRKPQKVFTDVRPARKKVVITLTADHVRAAMAANGHGNAQMCAGAVCSKAHSDIFPHKFTGYVDWLYKRTYVSSKNRNGLPSESVAYSHNDSIAKLFDTKDGLKKLLVMLERDGPKRITLYPPKYHKRPAGRPSGGSGGASPARKSSAGQGHMARVNTIKLGGFL